MWGEFCDIYSPNAEKEIVNNTLYKKLIAKEMTGISLELVEKRKLEQYDSDFHMCMGILTGIIFTLGKDIDLFKEDWLGYTTLVIEELISL